MSRYAEAELFALRRAERVDDVAVVVPDDGDLPVHRVDVHLVADEDSADAGLAAMGRESAVVELGGEVRAREREFVDVVFGVARHAGPERCCGGSGFTRPEASHGLDR